MSKNRSNDNYGFIQNKYLFNTDIDKVSYMSGVFN